MSIATDIQQLYIGYLGRAADQAGLAYWVDKVEHGGWSVTDVALSFADQPEYDAIYGVNPSRVQLVALTYNQLFGRDFDNAGLEYWTNGGGKTVPDNLLVEAFFNGASSADQLVVANKVEVSQYYTEKKGSPASYNQSDAREVIEGVTVNHDTVELAKDTIDGIVSTGNVFTLTESIVEGHDLIPAVTKVYWGYNPHDNGSGHGTAADGGVPVEDMLSFLTTITGLDLKELGLVDDDGVGPFDNVTSVELEYNNGEVEQDGDADDDSDVENTADLIINYADGTFMNAEAVLGPEYMAFLNNLLFDVNGNTRLYEKVIVPEVPATEDTIQPIVLTTYQNNGGTIEAGNTSLYPDTIVAGRLELLHGAYIDAGSGYDILEVDAKGVYAQPKQLLNIEEIRVQNMANVYTTSNVATGSNEYVLQVDGSGNLLLDGSGNTKILYDDLGQPVKLGEGYLGNSTYPLLSGIGPITSFLDITRATSLEKLVVTEAYDSIGGSGQTVNMGALTIVGIRNDAVTRLEGGFSEPVILQYGQGIDGTLELELALGDVTAPIMLLQNAAVINIDSTGIENHMHTFFAGGSISRMYIEGTGVFAVDQNLASSFNAGRPVIIDASANTGGLDITIEDGSGSGDLGFAKVTVKGTQADDEITVNNICAVEHNAQVVIEAGNGNNTITADGNDFVTITSGTGNDIIFARDGVEVTITAGNGRNTIDADGGEMVTITSGTGNDSISAQDVGVLTIDAGAGNNLINANQAVSSSFFALGVVNITTGAGNDSITAVRNDVVTINAGDGTNSIIASANEINITTGSGNDTVTIFGMDTEFDFGDQGDADDVNNDWNDDNYVDNDHFVDEDAPGALLTLNLGAGVNTINLGRDVTDVDQDPDVDVQYGITALEGSVITGTGIKLFVENHSDLTQADLTNATITSVVLKQELRITDDQFADIGSAAFSVLRDEEGATEDLYIVIGQDGQETVTLGTLVNLATLSANVRLHFELHNNSTLILTAEQLHKYVSWHGIDSTDGLNGKVVITDAGQNFDPFDNGNNYQVIDGGSLTDTFDLSEDVTILRKLDGGFERPAPAPSTDTLILDSNVDAVIETAINSEVATLKIIGDVDITFEHTVNLGRDAAAAVLADGTQGDTVAPETDAYTIDFSTFNADVIDLTLANFQDVKQVKGNGSATRDVRIDVELTAGSSVGASGNANGLKSSGVQTYVVTAIGDDSVGEDTAASSATFYVCDMTKDIEVLGLRGNHNDTINFLQVNWGTNFLLEGGGDAKADGNPSFSNIGTLHAEYFWAGSEPHANSIVNIVNLDAAPARPLNVAGIDIDNADSITINVTGSNAVIQDLSGSSVESLTFVSAFDVTVRGDLEAGSSIDAKGLSVLDASGVAGVFTLELSNNEDTNLSEAVVTGLDKVVISGEYADLTLTADQLVTLGVANLTSTDAATSAELHVTEFSNQAIDFTAIDIDDIEDVTFADVDGTIVVDPGTVFGNADNTVEQLIILAEDSDTTVEMTAAQFDQLDGNGTVTASTDHSAATGDEFVATLVLTDLAVDEVIVLSSVTAAGADGVSVVVRVEDLVATDDMSITGHDVALEVSGAVDLTEAAIPTVQTVDLAAGAVLTLTAAQVLAIGIDDADADGVADNWAGLAGATLHITDLGTQELDLDAIAAAGIDIGTLTLADTNALITLHTNTTLGGADSIITPIDTVDGIENTSLSLTAAQFDQLAGTGTITGGATVNITNLINNVDIDGLTPLTPDVAVIDVSGITAPKGTIGLGQLTVTLDATSNIAGFELLLTNGQMIEFTTAAQASGQEVTEVSGTTAIAWLFDTLGALTEIDTSKYDADINTLFILEDLVDGINEESLWNTLADSIVVEKVNIADIPDVLIGVDRVNTFEALTAIAGVTYDDVDEFESIQNLTINLEGNTNIGNVVIADSMGEVAFQALIINSYVDRSTLSDDNGFTFQPNKVGNITISDTADANITVTLNTYADVDNIIGTGDDANGYVDPINVNSGVAERDGLALEVGTITFAAEAGNTVTLDLNGANDITIAGLDISDPDITLLKVDASGHTGDLEITGIDPVDGINDFDFIYIIDGHTAETGDVLHAVAGDDVLLVVAGGANDLTEIATASFEVDAVHFTANATLTLTADQLAAIGTADVDADGVADAWSIEPGVVVTLNIIDLDGTHAFDLNAIQDAGINIGEITVIQGTIELNAALTLGGADMVTIEVDSANSSLELTATQFQQIDGTIEEDLTADAVVDGFNATVIVDELEGIENATTGLVTINLSTVNTTGANTVAISDYGPGTLVPGGNGDVELAAAANLAGFSVTLNDINSNAAVANELAGETIRFATAVQAERAVIVIGEDANDGTAWASNTEYFERDTNVIWLFDTITGTATANKIDTSDYDAGLGRVWVNDVLVDGENVEAIFSSPSQIETDPDTGIVNLNSTTIIRVVNTADLDELLPENVSVSRTVEVEAFTQLPGGLVFSNPDKLVDVDNLTLDLGGALDIGNISIDDIVAASIINNNSFGTLTINSLLANTDTHYLLPEDWDTDVNPRPDELPAAQQINVLGNISSGATRSELANVTINATGTGLNTGTITFVETTNLTTNPSLNTLATLRVTGSQNVNIASVDTSDVDITALTVNTTGYTGVLTAPGTSPGLQMNNTQTLTFVNDGGAPEGGDGTITLGSATNAGVAGNELSFITASGYDGTLNLGIVAQIDSTNDDNNADGDTTDAGDAAFTFTAGQGVTTMTLDTANSLTPTLAAGSDWVFNFTGANTASRLTITDDVVFNAGDLTLTMDNAELVISGEVDLTALTSFAYSNGASGFVILDEATSVLKMTDAQWLASGLVDGDFRDASGNPPVLHVTAALLATIGNDLTLVRGYAGYNIDTGLSVTLREDQADIAVVNGGLVNGVLTGANVTVFVQETGFGNQNITNLVDVYKLVLEADATDNTDGNLATLPNTFGYAVTMTVQQADSLVGDITKNGNTVTALTGVNAGGSVDLTTPALNLVEVDSLTLQDATIISQSQFVDVGAANITGIAFDLTLKAAGDLTALNLGAATGVAATTVVDNILITGNTTITAVQEAGLSGTITQDVPASAYTLTINGLENLQAVAGDIQSGNITADFFNITVNTLTVNFNTTIPADYEFAEWTINKASVLHTARLVLSGGEVVNMDIEEANGRTITGTATVDLIDDDNDLNGTIVNLANIAASVAGVLTIDDDSVVTLNVATDLGEYDVNVTAADTLTLTGAQVSGVDVTGAGNVVLNNVTSSDDLTGIVNAGTLTINALGAVFSLKAIQADGAFIVDADDAPDVNLLTVNVTDFEEALGANLGNLNAAAYDINVALDSTGNVQIGETANLNTSVVTISGNGRVTVADDSADPGADGADVNTASFIVEAGATLVADQTQTDGDSVVTIANVSGGGTLEITGLDLLTITLIAVGTDVNVDGIYDGPRYTNIELLDGDDGVIINNFTAGVFVYDTVALELGVHRLDFTDFFAGAIQVQDVDVVIAADDQTLNANEIMVFSVASLADNLATSVQAAFADNGAFDGVDGDATAITFAAGADKIFVTRDGAGADAMAWFWQDGIGGASDGLVTAGELTQVATIQNITLLGLSDMADFNFVLA